MVVSPRSSLADCDGGGARRVGVEDTKVGIMGQRVGKRF